MPQLSSFSLLRSASGFKSLRIVRDRQMQSERFGKTALAEQKISEEAQTRLAILVLAISVLLMTGCEKVVISETEATICRELWSDFPSWSSSDTEQSKEDGADFIDLFKSQCGDYL